MRKTSSRTKSLSFAIPSPKISEIIPLKSIIKTENIQLDFDEQRKRKQSFLPGNLQETEKKWSRNISIISQTNVTASAISCIVYEKTNAVSNFITGSKYIGQYNELGLAGKGIYKYPHGVIYDGQFNQNGEFHGNGALIYPNGQKIHGMWLNGKLDLKESNKQEWVLPESYCKMPDRRYQREIQSDLLPATQEIITAEDPSREIPKNCYDCGEGIYDPNLKVIKSYDNNAEIVRTLSQKENLSEYERQRYKDILANTLNENQMNWLMKTWPRQENDSDYVTTVTGKDIWIKKNCRKAWDENVGYKQELYEIWTPGYHHNIPDDNDDNDNLTDLSSRSSDVSDYYPELCFKSFFTILESKVSNNLEVPSSSKPDTPQRTSMMFGHDFRMTVLNKMLHEKLRRVSIMQRHKSIRKRSMSLKNKHLLPKLE